MSPRATATSARQVALPGGLAAGAVSAYAMLRANMVDGQLRPHRINQPAVLQRFAQVPREVFVAPAQRALAYADAAVALPAPGREMVMPMVVAHLVQALCVNPADHVLVLAGGTGYSAAILAGLAAQVTLQEEDPDLCDLARTHLAALPQVMILQGSITQPAMPARPYDAILIDAPVGYVPAAVLAVLKEGGKLACVRQIPDSDAGLLEVVLLTKQGKTCFEDVLFETKGSVLPALRAPQRFVF